MDDVIKLVARTFTKNEYGVDVWTESSREVYAEVRSVSRTEFFDGGRNGLNPEYVIDIFAGDYDGEAVCEYAGKRYGVYRFYKSSDSDYIELYVERKGGTNGTS